MARNILSVILSVLFYSAMFIVTIASAILFYSLVDIDNILWAIIITCCYIIMFTVIIRDVYITLKYDRE